MLEKSGTFLHTSARDHAQTLAPALDQYPVDETAMRAALPPARPTTPSCVVHDAEPTRVVQMEIDDDLIANLERELLFRSKIDAAISNLAAGTYFPLSTQFENSILFLPSAQRFYHRNKHIIHSNFPEIGSATVNAFVVPPGTRPYGAHNAGSIGFQVPALAKRGYAYPKKHVSFHTAVTPTPLDKQPFVIFEDAVPESPNSSFLYENIRSHQLSAEESFLVDKAFYLHDSGQLSAIHLTGIRDLLLCKYWEKKYSDSPELAAGYFCNAKPGQALYFDNYRPHGDGTLQPSTTPRVTIDMRCFSRVEYPSKSITSGVDLLLDPENKRLQRESKRATLECLLLMLGYQDIDEFLKLIYGGRQVDPFDIMTDLQFSVYNTNDHYILEQNLEPHYERVARIYEAIEREGEFIAPDRARAAMDRLAVA